VFLARDFGLKGGGIPTAPLHEGEKGKKRPEKSRELWEKVSRSAAFRGKERHYEKEKEVEATMGQEEGKGKAKKGEEYFSAPSPEGKVCAVVLTVQEKRETSEGTWLGALVSSSWSGRRRKKGLMVRKKGSRLNTG